MPGKRRKVNPRDLLTAQAESKLRFGPDRAALATLVDQAASDYQTDVRSAGAAARTTRRGAKASIPVLHKIYSQAASGVKAAQDDVERAFNQGGVTPDNSFRLASEAEGAAYRNRLTSESAAARRESVRQMNEAALGKVFAVGEAKERYRANLNTLSDRLRDLGDQEGAYVVSRLATLGQQRSDRALKKLGYDTQLKVADIYSSAKGGSSASVAGNKPATRSELRSFKTNFAKALRYAHDYSAAKYGRGAAATELTTGKPAYTQTTKKGKVKYPAVPAIGDQLAISVALDMAYGGHVSKRNQRLLHEAGLRVDDLPGARSYGRWLKQVRADQRRASQNRARQYGSGVAY